MDTLNITDLPYELLVIVANNCHILGMTVLSHVSKGFRELIRGNSIFPINVCTEAAAANYFNVLKWAYATGYKMSASPQYPAKNGNVDMLVWIHENREEWDVKIVWLTYKAAVSAGHLNIIKWLKYNGYALNWKLHYTAAKHGQCMILKWLLSNGYLIGAELFARAAKSNNLNLLKWLRNSPYGICPFDCSTFINAVAHGCINTLEWLHEERCPSTPEVYSKAAQYGHINAIKWLHSHGYEWSETVWNTAAAGGYLDILKWLHEAGCPKSVDTYSYAAENGHIHVIEWLQTITQRPTNLCIWAVSGGHLEMLKWLREQNYPWGGDVCEQAILHGHFDCLKWAHENGCLWNSDMCVVYATCVEDYLPYFQRKNDNGLKILKYLHKEGCNIYKAELCTNAVISGYFEMLKWLRKHGCPWDSRMCEEVCRSKHTSMLDWIRKNGRVHAHNEL